MGVVNVTPDSFSDGGLYLDPSAAIAHGRELAGEGAAILDVGGESTRPGADPVAADEETRRVEPVVAALAGVAEEISVDTSKAAVAAVALDAGASIVNDVTALRGDPEMAALVADRGAGLVLMHMAGDPRTMQADPRYGDVVAEVSDFLAARLEAAVAAGVDESRIWLDPGIGFGKTDRPISSFCAASPSWPSSAARSSSGPRARASSAAPTIPRPVTASAARSPPRSSPRPRAPRSSASTTCGRCRRR